MTRSGPHRPPQPADIARAMALLSRLYPIAPPPYPALALAQIVGASRPHVTSLLTGKRAVSDATLTEWERRVDEFVARRLTVDVGAGKQGGRG
jgi:hypothetical protein